VGGGGGEFSFVLHGEEGTAVFGGGGGAVVITPADRIGTDGTRVHIDVGGMLLPLSPVAVVVVVVE